MIARPHPLPVRRQCPRLKLARSTAYSPPTPVAATVRARMRRLDALQLQDPLAGARLLRDRLRQEGRALGRRPVRRRGSEALDRTPSLSRRPPRHPLSPSLLRDRTISQPNHVWAAEMPDLPLSRGFVYVFAVFDWASRRVLAWRRSNTLPTDFCLDAVPDARGRYGPPELFHPEQGGQCTSPAVTGRLTPHGIPLSMEGNGWGRDNVFVARFWKSITICRHGSPRRRQQLARHH